MSKRDRLVKALSDRLGMEQQAVIEAALLMMLRRVATDDAKYGCQKRGKDRFREFHAGDEKMLAKMEAGERNTMHYPPTNKFY